MHKYQLRFENLNSEVITHTSGLEDVSVLNYPVIFLHCAGYLDSTPVKVVL
jgi:hypothetical protein